jgi:glutathione S-transferase
MDPSSRPSSPGDTATGRRDEVARLGNWIAVLEYRPCVGRSRLRCRRIRHCGTAGGRQFKSSHPAPKPDVTVIGRGRPWSGVVENRCRNGDHHRVVAKVSGGAGADGAGLADEDRVDDVHSPRKENRPAFPPSRGPTMKLYYSPGACSMAPHIVATEAGIPLDLVKVDIPNKKTADGADFWLVNPKGYVPALQLDDGTVLTEVGVICQYLADQKPDSGLMAPAGTMQRYHQMEALNFAATEVHKQIGALFNPRMTPEMKEVQLAVIARRLGPLDKALEGRQYVMGDSYTAPDAYLFTVLNWTRPLKIDLAPWPAIQAFMTRVAARPKVQQTLKAEGLV